MNLVRWHEYFFFSCSSCIMENFFSCSMQKSNDCLRKRLFLFHILAGITIHYFGQSILHGGAKYRATERRFVVTRENFEENYKLYPRSHFTKGLELMMLLFVYNIYRGAIKNSLLYFYKHFHVVLDSCMVICSILL